MHGFIDEFPAGPQFGVLCRTFNYNCQLVKNYLLRAARGARNPDLRVANTHARHVHNHQE